ncbi:aminotransferase class III-fold pyridoxal phosphate-dependent enzyme [Streptomyces sp. NPDC046985]|uniref:aminotransferase class III-fold pyridoxal phosphate-dependent enzyme n=1 Tax=Streptomyces sp. NPDC046985 TaxID=3155377 RepID=UPI0033F8C4EE
MPRRQAARESAARTIARSLPIVPVRARGLTIEGADGRRYLDCLSGAGALALGHNHPVVLHALRKALDSGAPLHAPGLATPVEDALVAELFGTLPAGLADRARVRFCGPAGTDAAEAARTLVEAATGRTGIMTFTGAHRGTTAGALAASGHAPDVRAARPPARLPSSRDFRCPFGVDGSHGAELAARWSESVLDAPGPGAPLPAGMIFEPVQGECGVTPAPEDWMRRLRRITAARSVPLIVDETRTGVGRTGAFWVVEHSGVTPDVMVLSKAVGGSLPLAVVVHRDDLDVREQSDREAAFHGDFRGNQLAMAAGAATLAHVRENRLAARAGVLGARMLARLRALSEEHSCIGDVRGRGLMIGLELVDPDAVPDPAAAERPEAHDPRPAAPELAAAVQRECLRRGLIVGLGGRHTSVVQLLPPLTITDEQSAAVLDRLADAIGAAARDLPRHLAGRSGRPPGQAGPPGPLGPSGPPGRPRRARGHGEAPG